MIGPYNRSSRVACRLLRIFFQKELVDLLEDLMAGKIWFEFNDVHLSMSSGCLCPHSEQGYPESE